MLHPIEPVMETELRAVLAFQRDVLALACRSDLDCSIQNTRNNKGRFVFDEQQLDAALDTRAPWVKRHPSLHARIKAVNAAVRSDASLGTRFLEIFDHDTGFEVHCDDPSFALKVGQLPAEVLKPLKELLEAFYELLSREKGFESEVTGCGGVSRRALVRAFWERHAVCPACDAAKPDALPTTDGAVGGQCDHHLPKSAYPTLSVHPLNLVPTCSDCNAVFKGTRDPLKIASLAELFLPYRRPMFGSARIVVSRPGAGALALAICDEPTAPTARVSAFDYAYQLLDRWTVRINGRVKGDIQNHLRRAMVNRTNDRWGAAAVDAAAELRDQSDYFRERRGAEKDALLSEAYCAFAAADEDELCVFRDCAGTSAATSPPGQGA